ncbi:MAG: Flavin reductase [Pedosphaera sp.]|nr:Flavin reductase [Pedosphaera sp.]
MRLFILGATGRTGQALIGQARKRGHHVTAFVRSPQKLGGLGEGVTIRQGDPRSIAELSAALPNHDAVLSALGPPGLGRTTILRDCASSTVGAMRAANVRQLLVISAAVLFRDAGILPALMRHTLLRNVAEDSAEMERVVIASGLDWTVVRPPRLTNGRLTGKYRVREDHLPNFGFTISRADVADFMIKTAENRASIGKIIGVSN